MHCERCTLYAFNSLMDSVGEGEGGKIWENGIEKKKKKRMSLAASLKF